MDQRSLPNRSVELGRGGHDVDVRTFDVVLPKLRDAAVKRHQGKETKLALSLLHPLSRSFESLPRVNYNSEGCVSTTCWRRRRVPAFLSFSLLLFSG